MARMPRRRVLHDSALVGLQFMQGAPTWTSPEPSLGPRLTVEFEDGRIVFAHLSAGTAQTLARAAEIGEEMPCSSSVLSCRARRRPRSWACRAPPSSSCSRSRPRPRSSTRRSGAYGPERSRSRRRKRTGAVVEATGDLQWLEWSLPDEDDLDDFDAVKRANPAPWIGLASHAAHTIAKHSRRGWRIGQRSRGWRSRALVSWLRCERPA